MSVSRKRGRKVNLQQVVIGGFLLGLAAVLAYYGQELLRKGFGSQAEPMPIVREFTLSARIPVNTGRGDVVPEYDRASGVDGAGHFYFLLSFLSRVAFTPLFKGSEAIKETPVLPASDRPTTDKEAAAFAAELSQYVVFRLIDLLQHSAIPVLGGSSLVSRAAIIPPEAVVYPSDALIEELDKNRFSRIGQEPETWHGGWRVKTPKDTVIRFGRREGESLVSPTYVIDFRNPPLYGLTVTVHVSGTGSGGNLADYIPAGFKVGPEFVTAGKVYYVSINCRFEYRQTSSDDALKRQEYTNWAEALFAGLRTMIEQ
jgi:hypothetical protein